MTFRTRLFLIFVVAVVATVLVVGGLVAASTRDAFERLEAQRADALVAQFRLEFERRGREIVRDVKGIAESETATRIAIALNQPAPDLSPYVNDAGAVAEAHSLDLLELVADDGAIISSAQWPARFGYKETWITEQSGWQQAGAFLRLEQLPEGVTLALVAVGAAAAGERKVMVIGGHELDREFLSSLVLPSGMRVLLDRNFDLIDASGPVPQAGFDSLLSEVRRTRREVTRVMRWSNEAARDETFHAIPLRGLKGEMLGTLLVGSSRRALVELERRLRWTGILTGAGGVLVAVILSWWATARVTRPVKRLAERAQDVAGGNWSATVDVQSGDEIGQLARAFNRMTHELVEQRERLVQAERVAAWRELARRLAHELKNPLFPLQITVENLRRARESSAEQFDEVFCESTDTLLAELANLKQIVARFSEFAKMPPPELQPVDLNEVAAATIRLFAPQLESAHVDGQLELDPTIRPVQADPEQVSGALRNLVLNAIDAMPHGGRLTIRTAQHNGSVRLEVEDTGQGLTPEECERLFTPYYTTKSHGTGLGLAIVQSVVSDHKGRISVESQPGKGTTFRIDLHQVH
jgi:signal transduction histidine kinase